MVRLVLLQGQLAQLERNELVFTQKLRCAMWMYWRTGKFIGSESGDLQCHPPAAAA